MHAHNDKGNAGLIERLDETYRAGRQTRESSEAALLSIFHSVRSVFQRTDESEQILPCSNDSEQTMSMYDCLSCEDHWM